MLAQLETFHPDQIQIIYRHFPLMKTHDKASLAGQAAEAAGAQGEFWAMHDLLFDQFGQWTDLSPPDFLEWLVERSVDLGLDQAAFQEDLEGGRYEELMQTAYTDAIVSGVSWTPFLFLNGQLVRYEPSLTNLEATVRLILLAERTYDEYPAMMLETGADYIARLQLSVGEVVIELFPDTAPLGVNSFIFLSQEGWYDNNPLHKIIPETLIESGDPTGTGFGEAGYHFQTETDPEVKFDQPGMVALESASPDTNSSVFFISLSPLPELDGSRTIIGRVIQGLDVLQALSSREPLRDLLEPPEAEILSIVIEKK